MKIYESSLVYGDNPSNPRQYIEILPFLSYGWLDQTILYFREKRGIFIIRILLHSFMNTNAVKSNTFFPIKLQ